MASAQPSTSARPRVLVLGGGFAGIGAAKKLRKSEVDVVLVDKHDYHTFQPLLYQVATGLLEQPAVGHPIRDLFHKQDNIRVHDDEVTAIDLAAREVRFGELEPLAYDYLVVALGAEVNFFGVEGAAEHAFPLYTLSDAVRLKNHVLERWEAADRKPSLIEDGALNMVVVGGGPTGVELAGAIKEIAGQTIPKDYRHIDTRTTRVVMFEGGDRILPQFLPELSTRAQSDLERMGVEVRLNSSVTNVIREGVSVGDEFIPVRNVFWAAGVKASPLGQSLGIPLDRAGRVIVGPDLTIPGHPEVFVAGDMAAAKSADTGKPVPGVAQGGIQMGRYAGRTIAAEVAGRSTPAERTAFIYRDKGTMAVIGKAKAVAQIGTWKLGGFFAWLLWGGIHILFLIGFRNRWRVLLSWFWDWLLNVRDARLITGDVRPDIQIARPPDFVPDNPTEVVVDRRSAAAAGEPPSR
jgi:NADH dehydrogenase